MVFSVVTHVAVGVIINQHDQVLVSKRRLGSHRGGLWEFPGGKKEISESIEQALKRELFEELGISLTKFHPFTKVLHKYDEKTVLLDVWIISGFDGHAEGREGQVIEWRNLQSLQPDDFPEANAEIIKLVKLPKEIAITPDLDTTEELAILFKQYAKKGIRLIQFRQKKLNKVEYIQSLKHAFFIAQKFEINLIANHSFGCLHANSSIGFHANSKTLMSIHERPVSKTQLFSASCHSLNELVQAEKLNTDFVTLSPVCYTPKYSHGFELGWEGFADLANSVSLPVYALGGVGRDDLGKAERWGAYGVAGITSYL